MSSYVWKTSVFQIFTIPILAYILPVVPASSYDCNNCGLSNIPTSIPQETTRLYLKGNRITSLSRTSLIALTNITLLDIRRNSLTNVQLDCFSGLKITELVLSYNHLSSVPNVEPLAYYLRSLDLRNNHISTIEPFTFTNFTAISTVYLSFNFITSLPDFAFHTPRANLRALYINANGLYTLGKFTFAQIALHHLVLENNALTEMPCLSNARRVYYPNLRGNPITKIPDGCSQGWSRMHNLYLERTRLTSVDNITKYANNLLRFHIDGSPVVLSDETFKNTHRLQYIYMGDISQFPMFNASKATLLHVQLSGTAIHCIEEAWLDGMDTVVTFILRHTSVAQLPNHGCSNDTYEDSTIHGYFQSLINLEIQYSKLTHFPNLTSLGNESSLTYLRLRENKISFVPCYPDKFKLYDLVFVDLHTNQVSHICNLNFAPNIKYLLLTKNLIADFMFIENTTRPLTNMYYIEIEWISIGFLNDSALRVIPNCGQVRLGWDRIKVFPNIKLIADGVEHIALQGNLISNVPCIALDKMEKLNHLNLDANIITYVCPLLLTLAPKLTVLVLSRNRLVEITDLRIPTRMQTTRVLLNSNPFRCLKTMCWMLFVPHESYLKLEIGNTVCLDGDGIARNIFSGLTTECTCKFFDYYQIVSLLIFK